MEIRNPKGTRKKGRWPGAVFLGLLLWCLCAGHTSSAQVDTFRAGNLRLSHYIESPDTIAKYGRDTIWEKFFISFAATDITRIRKIRFYAGTVYDSANVLTDSIALDSIGDKFYSEGICFIPISGNMVGIVIKIPINDAADIKSYWADLYDKNRTLLQRIAH